MSEYVKRNDVLRIMRRAFDFDYDEATAVENLPTVEVVHCCDCKHKEHCYSMVHMFVENERDTVHRYIDYCSYGEQKEQENE